MALTRRTGSQSEKLRLHAPPDTISFKKLNVRCKKTPFTGDYNGGGTVVADEYLK
jgi:hypothetical protein